MRRVSATLGSALFLVVAPGGIAVLVPWWLTRWQLAPPLLGHPASRIAGALLMLAGLPILLDSFARFALQGLGTPAPIAPPKHLVVTGWYRWVRNPMYVAVASLLIGQGLFFASIATLEYAASVIIAFHLFVVLYEEPKLKSLFGSEYDDYRSHVRRWIPHLRPWNSTKAKTQTGN